MLHTMTAGGLPKTPSDPQNVGSNSRHFSTENSFFRESMDNEIVNEKNDSSRMVVNNKGNNVDANEKH